MKFHALVALAAGACLSSCASIVGGGSSQEIQVTTNPAGANCVFMRNGERIGAISSTPGSLLVKRRKYDIEITCDKAGYAQTKYHNKSGLSSMVAGNVAADLILTAGISSIVDSSTGADNEYTSNVVITMQPLTAGGNNTAAALAAR